MEAYILIIGYIITLIFTPRLKYSGDNELIGTRAIKHNVLIVFSITLFFSALAAILYI